MRVSRSLQPFGLEGPQPTWPGNGGVVALAEDTASSRQAAGALVAAPLEARPVWGKSGPPLADEDLSVPPWFVARDEPSQVVLRLHEELLDFAAFIRPTATDEAAHRRWVSKIEVAARSLWQECEVYVFGSRATGLCLPSADVDIAISKVPLTRAMTALKHVAERMLGSGEVSRLEIIQSEKVPILKLQEQSTGIWADIVVNHLDGLSASYFVREQMEAFPAMTHLMLFLKLFLLQRGLQDASTGGMNSYILMCVLLSFLQRHPSSRIKHLHETTGLGHLLLDFFRCYGQDFDYATLGISVANGGTLFDRKARGWTGSTSSLCLESPQEPGVDIGARVLKIGAIRAAFNQGYQHLGALLLSRGPARQSSLLCPQLIHLAHPVISQRFCMLAEQPPLLAHQPPTEPQPLVEPQPRPEVFADSDETEGEDFVSAKRQRLGTETGRTSETVVICPTGVEDPMGEVLDALCASQDAEGIRDEMEEVLDTLCASTDAAPGVSPSRNDEAAHDPMGAVLDMLVAEVEEEEVLDVPLGEADAEAAVSSRSQADNGEEEVLLLPSRPSVGEELDSKVLLESEGNGLTQIVESPVDSQRNDSAEAVGAPLQPPHAAQRLGDKVPEDSHRTDSVETAGVPPELPQAQSLGEAVGPPLELPHAQRLGDKVLEDSQNRHLAEAVGAPLELPHAAQRADDKVPEESQSQGSTTEVIGLPLELLPASQEDDKALWQPPPPPEACPQDAGERDAGRMAEASDASSCVRSLRATLKQHAGTLDMLVSTTAHGQGIEMADLVALAGAVNSSLAAGPGVTTTSHSLPAELGDAEGAAAANGNATTKGTSGRSGPEAMEGGALDHAVVDAPAPASTSSTLVTELMDVEPAGGPRGLEAVKGGAVGHSDAADGPALTAASSALAAELMDLEPAGTAADSADADSTGGPNGLDAELMDVETSANGTKGPSRPKAAEEPRAGTSLPAPDKAHDPAGGGDHGAIGKPDASVAAPDEAQTLTDDGELGTASDAESACGGVRADKAGAPCAKRKKIQDAGDKSLGVSPCTEEEEEEGGMALGSVEDEAAYYRTAGSLAELAAEEREEEDFESVASVKAKFQAICDDCPDFEDI